MGKFEEEQSLSSTVAVDISSEGNVDGCRRISKFVRLRCIIALILGAAVLLSAIFWLPPFLQYGDRWGLDPDSQYGDHDVVASFKLQKPASFLNANIQQLEHDIFDEIAVSNSMIVIISLEPFAGSNTTTVVFGVVPNATHSNISPAGMSLLRATFVSLVIQQSSLYLTSSLFGSPFSFEVLKFRGGITVIPEQSAFLLQKVQILFNFTLNFSINQIQEKFNELRLQLKSGLHLSPYENLYVSLTNSKGSTVTPPTTVQASVLLAIGNLPSSRLKQLAQTITGSPARNLGLNNTVFGRVKQVRLSSVLQHSLNGGPTPGSPSPGPAPLPNPYHHYNHHHHHHPHHRHHHHHDQAVYLAPVPAPAPAPVPVLLPVPVPAPDPEVKPPARCENGFPRKAPVPAVSPPVSPRHPAASPHHSTVVHSPAPALHMVSSSSPLPTVVFAHVRPPSGSITDVDPPDVTPSVSPMPSSSSVGLLPSMQWAFPLLLPLIYLL